MGKVQHGTNACYTSGCRKEACRQAHSEYMLGYRRRRAHAQWGHDPSLLVDPAAAVERVADLQRRGMDARAIAAATGVSRDTVTRLAGTHPSSPLRRISQRVMDAILACDPGSAKPIEPGYVDSAPTVRKLRALAALGWSAAELRAHLGMHTTMVHLLARGDREQVLVRTAEAVAGAYRALHMTPGPSKMTQLRARKRGWLPPLAWDDIDAGIVGDTVVTAGCPLCDEIERALRAGQPPHEAARVVSSAIRGSGRAHELKRHLHLHARWDLLEGFGMVEVSA